MQIIWQTNISMGKKQIIHLAPAGESCLGYSGSTSNRPSGQNKNSYWPSDISASLTSDWAVRCVFFDSGKRWEPGGFGSVRGPLRRHLWGRITSSPLQSSEIKVNQLEQSLHLSVFMLYTEWLWIHHSCELVYFYYLFIRVSHLSQCRYKCYSYMCPLTWQTERFGCSFRCESQIVWQWK